MKTEILNLIERAEEYYEATFQLNDAERVMRATDSAKDATPHELVDAQVSLFGCKTEALRAAGALLVAVEAYRRTKDVRCSCQLEAGDSPCKIHGEDDE